MMRKLILTERQFSKLLLEYGDIIDELPDGLISRNNIESLDYLGKGDFGEVYAIDDEKVLKITNSETDFKISQKIQQHKNLKHVANVYDTLDFGHYYYIVKEYVEEDYEIENLYYTLQAIYATDGVSIVEGLSYFDMDEYQEAHGEVDQEVLDFADELREVIREMKMLGVNPYYLDLKADNFGRDSNGNLKLFDYLREIK